MNDTANVRIIHGCFFYFDSVFGHFLVIFTYFSADFVAHPSVNGNWGSLSENSGVGVKLGDKNPGFHPGVFHPDLNSAELCWALPSLSLTVKCPL